MIFLYKKLKLAVLKKTFEFANLSLDFPYSFPTITLGLKHKSECHHCIHRGIYTFVISSNIYYLYKFVCFVFEYTATDLFFE